MESLSTPQAIDRYFLTTTEAIGTLFQKHLYAHVLILVYSTIDTCGLLDAPASQVEASGDSFKSWVNAYMLPHPQLEPDAIDWWAARCSVLHTFTSESKLSREGKARQLQYYSGDKSTPQAQHFVQFTRALEDGRHLPIHFGDLCEAFFAALKKFVYVLYANCAASPAHNTRLRNVLQAYAFPSAP